MDEEPKLEVSPLSQEISSEDKTVKIEIYRLEGDPGWALEVVDEYNNSTVWDDTFETESAALTEAKETILADGIRSLMGPENGKSNEGWK